MMVIKLLEIPFNVIWNKIKSMIKKNKRYLSDTMNNTRLWAKNSIFAERSSLINRKIMRKIIGVFKKWSRFTLNIWRIILPCGYSKTLLISYILIKSISMSIIRKYKNSKADEIVSCMRKNDYTKIPTCDKCNTYRISPNIYFKLPFSLKLNGYKWI